MRIGIAEVSRIRSASVEPDRGLIPRLAHWSRRTQTSRSGVGDRGGVVLVLTGLVALLILLGLILSLLQMATIVPHVDDGRTEMEGPGPCMQEESTGPTSSELRGAPARLGPALTC